MLPMRGHVGHDVCGPCGPSRPPSILRHITEVLYMYIWIHIRKHTYHMTSMVFIYILHTAADHPFFTSWGAGRLVWSTRASMNDHPGRDTDVRSRPSESTIKYISFYIGFTKIQTSNKHVGPCFGMNGHSRRDPDTISRLPDTTTYFPSVFTGFRCSNRVKMVV